MLMETVETCRHLRRPLASVFTSDVRHTDGGGARKTRAVSNTSFLVVPVPGRQPQKGARRRSEPRKCHPPPRRSAPRDARVLTSCPCLPPLRVDTKLQTLEARFAELDSSLQKLAQNFELQAQELEQEARQAALGTRAPAER